VKTRPTPYLLLAVLLLGTGLGIGLGLSESPSTPARTIVHYLIGPNTGLAVPRGSICKAYAVPKSAEREVVCSEPAS
jgi:hypothetical protein